MSLVTITEGWTQEIGPFTVRNNGTPVDLTGLTPNVTLWIRSSADSSPVDMTGNLRIDDAPSTGRFYIKPDAEDFVALYSPYYIHVEIEGSDGIGFFPNGTAETIVVTQR